MNLFVPLKMYVFDAKKYKKIIFMNLTSFKNSQLLLCKKLPP